MVVTNTNDYEDIVINSGHKSIEDSVLEVINIINYVKEVAYFLC